MTKIFIKNQKNSLNQHLSIEKTLIEQKHLSCLPPSGNSNLLEISISNQSKLSQQPGQEGRKVAVNQKDLQKLNQKKSKNQKILEGNSKKKSQNQKIQMPKADSIQVQNMLQSYKKAADISCSSNSHHHGTKQSKKKKGQQKSKGKCKEDELKMKEQFEANLARILQDREENQQTQRMRNQSFQLEDDPDHSQHSQNHGERQSVFDISLQSIEQSDREFQSNSHFRNQSSQHQSTERFQDVRKPLDRKSSDSSIISTSSEISLRNDTNKLVRFKKKDKQSYLRENQRIKFPPFPIEALKFKLHKFSKQIEQIKQIKQITLGTLKKNSFPYQLHEVKAFFQTNRYYSSKKKAYQIKTVDGWKILCINYDFNIPSGDRKIRNKYYQKDHQKRADQLVRIIISGMKEEVDFILLQEAYNETMRSRLIRALKSWNDREQCTYYYPKSLEKLKEQRTTLILSRHVGQFGQMSFQIEEFEVQDAFCYPKQAYFKFQIEIQGKKQSVCIMCCHLRSNAPPKKEAFLTPTQVRLQQFQCIEHFSRRFHQFFCIGDTNVPSSQNFREENLALSKLLADAINFGAEDRGTYLFRVSPQEILDERLDRVLRKIRNMRKAVVTINYRDDILLDCCRQLDVTQKQVLKEIQNEIIDIRVTDHAIMSICISYKA